MPKFRTVDYQEEEGIALVTLNRPEKLNAFNIRMRDELLEVLDIADADDCIRAIIFTGAGRGFCAGADLSSDTTFDFQAPGACVFGPDGTIDYNSPRARGWRIAGTSDARLSQAHDRRRQRRCCGRRCDHDFADGREACQYAGTFRLPFRAAGHGTGIGLLLVSSAGCRHFTRSRLVL